ncbi:glucosaminidase domain-containing protein [Minwuia thermotolerans]|uniref:Mannosyl-glycoprotein endo-beta-N-acetylglucosamidase-like domain-containing protein n=1 Tax=Minwuia thermotolerans TaxID=2056226 RepID=A0A2M9G683_9PROT|nr:glucosaminidase domain-containing protein [Minwuia thermotolerans]PJK31229.1 hypothetical protein CVT23_03090 [Minwuia thermotolerans]
MRNSTCLIALGLFVAVMSLWSAQRHYAALDEGHGAPVIVAADILYPPDIDAVTRKRIFFDTLRPIVRAENARIAKLRGRLLAASQAGTSGGWVEEAAARYGVDWTGREWGELLARVDTVPITLVLAQAAKESGWGQSRFARSGNNMFGQWCFREGCGMVPLRRASGKAHEVATFSSVNRSVRAYLHNINTQPAYGGLRAERARLRAELEEPTGLALAGGLARYSERGLAYVREVRDMIRMNRRLMLAAAPAH